MLRGLTPCHFKSTILLAALAFVAQGTQASEGPRPHPHPAAAARTSPVLENGPGIQLTRKAESKFYLYEHQFIKLLPLSREYMAERTALKQQAPADNLPIAPLLELDATFEQQCRQLLTPWQIDRLQKAHVELAPKESFAYFMATQLA